MRSSGDNGCAYLKRFPPMFPPAGWVPDPTSSLHTEMRSSPRTQPTRNLRMPDQFRLLVAGLAVWLSASWAVAETPDAVSARPLTFEVDIRPILRTHCFDCH